MIVISFNPPGWGERSDIAAPQSVDSANAHPTDQADAPVSALWAMRQWPRQSNFAPMPAPGKNALANCIRLGVRQPASNSRQ